MKKMTFMKFLVIFATVFGLAGVVNAERYAILVGVNEYVDDGNLNFAVQDVEALRDVLLLIGYRQENVYCLTSGSPVPTLPIKSTIEFVIKTVLAKAKPGDTVIIVMSGHGTEENGEACFCPMDTRTQKDLVSINDIVKNFGGCKATNKLMIVDACRPTMKLPPGFQPMQPLVSPAEGVMLLQSCAKGETSIESGLYKHGIFTYALLESFREAKNSDGDVTLLGLVAYATKKTQEIAAGANHKQTPYMLGNLTDFVLVPRGAVLPPLLVDRAEIDEARKYLDTMIRYQIDAELKNVDMKETDAKLKIRNSVVSMISENNLMKENFILLLSECRTDNDRMNLEHELIDVPLNEKFGGMVRDESDRERDRIEAINKFNSDYDAAMKQGPEAVAAFFEEKIKNGEITKESTVAGWVIRLTASGKQRLVPHDKYPLPTGVKSIFDRETLAALQGSDLTKKDAGLKFMQDNGITVQENANGGFDFFYHHKPKSVNALTSEQTFEIELKKGSIAYDALQGMGKYFVTGVLPSKDGAGLASKLQGLDITNDYVISAVLAARAYSEIGDKNSADADAALKVMRLALQRGRKTLDEPNYVYDNSIDFKLIATVLAEKNPSSKFAGVVGNGNANEGLVKRAMGWVKSDANFLSITSDDHKKFNEANEFIRMADSKVKRERKSELDAAYESAGELKNPFKNN